MIRRKPEEDQDNHDRWLVSYADFITLLFAFFVVMYAISSVNQKKYKQLSSSINTAFTNEKTVVQETQEQPEKPIPVTQVKPPKNQKSGNTDGPLTETQIQELQKERASMGTLGKNMAGDLSNLVVEGKIRVIQNNRGLRIDISDSLLFDTGSAELANGANDLLNKIAILMLSNNHAIQVEGHTDDTPIHTPVFYSNWELSAVRASSVVRMFHSLGIDEKRLSALGFGSTQPVSENNTAEGRTKNRRVSIVVLYDSLKADNIEEREILPKLMSQENLVNPPSQVPIQSEPTKSPMQG